MLLIYSSRIHRYPLRFVVQVHRRDDFDEYGCSPLSAARKHVKDERNLQERRK